ncbi:hypothetical protein JCM8097_006556 [Rhodosporidiobolus ruineniae]
MSSASEPPSTTSKPPPKKPGRRRIACSACSANKQKCDGATRYPCRRCELYGTECSYPNGEVPKTAVRIDTTPQVSAGPAASAAAPPALAAAAPSSSSGGSEDLAALVREMSARLLAIEAGLEADRRAGTRAPASNFAPPPSHLVDAQPSVSTATATTASTSAAHPDLVEMPPETNPLQVLVSTMEQMSRDEAATSEGGEEDELDDGAGASDARSEQESLGHLEQLAWKARTEPRSLRADAFARGIVTLEDVQAAFGFYVQRIQPWIPVVEKRPALVVREKSPFFFHVILLVTNYYNTSTSSRAKEVYAGLTAIVHELLVRHILAPDPSMLSRDFLRALLLLLYYKPVQASYAERGLKSSSRIVHASKVNALSSLMIHAMMRQTSSFLGIQQAPANLAAVLDAPASSPVPPAARDRALSDFRIWCTVIAADALGSLQNGRTSWTDGSAALRVARRFASLATDPTDARRAATVELYSIVSVPPSAPTRTNPVRYRLEQLSRINAELDAWKAYWTPILAEAQNKGDPLAYTVVQTIAQFVVIAVNGAVYTRWDLEKKQMADQGKEGRPTLTNEDWEHLQRAATAADNAIFIVSIEATRSGHPLREYLWPQPVNGYREALHLDPRITEDFKTALDTVSCVALAYSLIFLVRMASAGLITCDLTTRQADYEAGCDLSTPQALATGTKLPRLLELGAQFLTGISPNPDHPCCRHALLVEMILRVGLSVTTPQGHVPSPIERTSNKRSPATAGLAQGGAAHPQHRSSTFPLPPNQQVPPIPNPLPPHLQSNPPPPPPPAAAGNGARPSISSFDSWLWDTSSPNAASLSGPLRMHDGSFVMPDLAAGSGSGSGSGNGNGSGGAATPSPAAMDGPQPPSAGGARPSSRASNPAGSGAADRNAALAMVASAGRGGNAAQAMASLLSEVNPFLDDLYAQQPAFGLSSHAFNDDFGLGAAGVGAGMDGLGSLAGLEEWMPGGAAEGGLGGAWPFGSG